MINQERLKELLHYDPDSGVFTRAKDLPNGKKAGQIAGHVNQKGYIDIRLDGKNYRAARLAFLYMTGEWPSEEVDHDNRVKTDNRWINLRGANRYQNAYNKFSARKAKSGYAGVVKVKRKKTADRYRATIWANGVSSYLGTYATPEEAHNVYLSAVKDLHGEFGRFG